MLPLSQAVIRSILNLAVIAAVLFIAAGRLDIAEFWLVLAFYAAQSAITHFWLVPKAVDDQRREWLYAGMARFVRLDLVAHWLVAGLDRGVLHWSDAVPFWLQAAAFALMAAAGALSLWTIYIFLAIHALPPDTESAHDPIAVGPYRWVRNPGHLAAFVIKLASGLALGSWLSIVPLIPALMAMPFRSLAEERRLMIEMPGYWDYAASVRWRWIPGIW
jgi:protein-S-isoprenylcysteine O-methyltransferase Ste14